MQWNNFVAWGLLFSAVVGFVAMAFSGYDSGFSDALYTLAGSGLYIFGIWAAVRLFGKK